MNRRLQPTYLQMKLFAGGFMQIGRQTFSQDISALVVCGHILHGHIVKVNKMTNKMVKPGSTHGQASSPSLTRS